MSLGNDIHIKVLEIRGKRIRLGIEAPPNLKIFREELGWAEAQGLSPEGFRKNLALSKK
jgi:carbon storage regulator CsrA